MKRGRRTGASLRARRRAIKAAALLLAIWLPLMAVTPLAGAAPMRLPSRIAVRSSVLHFIARLAGEHQAPPKTPDQERGTAAGQPHQVPAGVTRAVARARGHQRGKGRGQVPLFRVRVPKKRQDTTGGAIGASHFNVKTSTLIDAKSTATSDLYRNTDGSYTRHVYAAPVNYQTSAGTWAPIQTALVAASGGGWREAANSVGVSFAARAASTGLGSLVFGGTNNGAFGVGFGLAGAAAVPGTAVGPAVTYPAVLPGTDLVEAATAVGISESLILHSAQAPGTWVFPLRLTGLTPTLRSDGSVALTDAAGTVEATIPGGLATDAAHNSGTTATPGTIATPGTTGTTGAVTPVAYQLVTYQGEPALQASIPAAWLASPDRVFPVTVDPSLNTTTTGSTSVIAPNVADYSGSALLDVGTYNASGQTPASPPVSSPSPTPTGTPTYVYPVGCTSPTCARAFLQFGGLSNTLATDTVTAATLNVWDAYATNCSTPEPFWVSPITEPWSVTGAQGWPGPSIGAEIGQSDVTAPPAACTNTTGNPTVGGWMSVTLRASAFNASQLPFSFDQPSAAQYGLALSSSLTDDNQWKEFDSFNTPDAPYLSLTYTALTAPQVATQYPPANYNSPSVTPVLMAAGTEPAGVTAALTYEFTVYDADGAQVASSGYTAASQWAVPWYAQSNPKYTQDLIWGQTYYWTAQVYNGTTYSALTPISYFTTNVPQPVLTSDLSQNTDGPGFNAADSDYATSVTDAQVSTVGPALSIARSYNSRDPRSSGAFGAGWSSILDMGAVNGQVDAGGNAHTVNVTYPDGQEVAFGANVGGQDLGLGSGESYTSPPGRYAELATASGGWTLTDKNDTVYDFNAPSTGLEPFTLGKVSIGGLASITDAYGNQLTFTRNAAGEATQMTSASGRTLSFTWATPTGALYPHVTKVTTNPVTAGNASTALTWTYSYTGDQLTGMCTPGSHCTTYAYTTGSDYPAAMLDTSPHSYWRLDEPAGTVAASSVLVNEGADNGTYSGVSLGQPGPLPGLTATSAGFNGTSSYLQLPTTLVSGADDQSVSMWFKTSTAGGVLLSNQASAITAAQTGSYTPELYIGSDGKLRGEFYEGADTPVTSAAAVNDGKWHQVVITAAGTTQTLYLDGTAVGTLSGTVANTGLQYQYVGAGYLGGSWPTEPHYSTSSPTGYATYFNGNISDVAFWDQSITAPQVTGLYSAGTTQGSWLTKVTRPTGSVYAQATYSTVTGLLTQVTDSNGGHWTMGGSTVTGSSQDYAGSMLAGDPTDYYRLSDTGTSTATDQVKGGTAAYNHVTQGVAGPFADTTADSFNGTSSYLALPAQDQVTTGPGTIELAFQTTGSNEVLYSTEATAAGAATVTGGYQPSLYIGSDGKLIGRFSNAYAAEVITSATAVNDGRWHFVALSASTSSQTLYLDGNVVGTNAGNLVNSGATAYAYLGTGYLGSTWPDESHFSAASSTGYASYFTGSIAEFAAFRSQLSAAQVAAQYTAAQNSQGLSPVQTVQVTDPGGKTLSWQYDPENGDRLIAQTDGDGDTTRYGYNAGGFLATTTDPDGDVTADGYDVRGNMVSKSQCQNQAAGTCSTSYYTYYPDDTTESPDADPRNDMMTASLDPRSSSATDTRYQSSYSYNTFGELTGQTTPPVAGYPAGQTTNIVYTCDWSNQGGPDTSEPGTTCVDAVDGGSNPLPYPPAGLPYTQTTPGGAVTTYLYDLNGDLVQVTNPDGQVTKYVYDGLGRLLTKTVISNSVTLATSYTYNLDGQVATETDPAVTNRVTGAVHTAQITTSYDADGDVLSQTVADTTGGDAARTQAFTYNGNDLEATATDPDNNVTSYTYNAYGDLAAQKDPASNVTNYSYDATGQLLTVTLASYTGNPAKPQPAAPLVESSRAYDPAGRLASITDSMGWVTSYGYTDDGLVASVTRSNPSAGTSYNEEADTYDAAGDLVAQTTNNGATTTDYAVDAAGRNTSQTLDPFSLDRTTSYAYNADGDTASETLTGAGSSTPTRSTSYTYDQMGNLTSQSQALAGSGNAPTAWWPLNQTSGNSVPDATGTGHTGTASDVTWSGGAAEFDGGDNYGDVEFPQITTAGPALDTTGSFTVSAWVNPSDTDGTETAVSQDPAPASTDGDSQTSGNSGFTLGIAGGVTNNFQPTVAWSFGRPLSTDPSSSFAEANSSATVTTGSWTHLVGVYNASSGTMTLYVNGVASGTATDTTPVASTGPMAIGRDQTAAQGNGDNFSGSLSDVQVYQQALTSAQVSALHSLGRLGGVNPANKLTTSWTLDQRGLPTSTTDPDGNTTYYSYDAAGRLAVTTDPAVTTQVYGGSPAPTVPVTMTGYNAFGDPVESSDANGNVTTTSYDAAGNPLTVTNPSYTPPGSTTPIVAVSSDAYNSLGQITSETDPLKNVVSYTYDQLGDVATQKDPDGGVTAYTYDTDGDQLSATDPTGGVSQATYDDLGRTVTSTQVERYPSAGSYTTTYAYAPVGGWLASETSPAGVKASYGHDAAGEQTSATDGANNTTQYGYDPAGDLTSTTYPDGTKTTAAFDEAGRQTGTADLNSAGTSLRSATSAYDADGNVVSSTDYRGHASTFSYSATGMLTQEVQPVTSSTAVTTSFGYDAAGNQTLYTDGNGSKWWTTYNTWNQPSTMVEPSTSQYSTTANSTFTDSYDADGRPVTQAQPGGVSVTNTYNAMSQLTGQSGSGATATTANRSFGYDLDGDMTSAGTATAGSRAATSESFTYDDRGLLLTGTGTGGSSTFAYNGDGDVTSVADSAGTTGYSYDTAGRLSSMTDPATGTTLSYGYNSLDQVSTVAYGASGDTRAFGYNGLHELATDTLATHGGSAVASIAYQYDPNGNLTNKTTTGFAGASANTYTYDDANRLTSWNNGAATTNYVYDADGNRTKAGAVTYTYDARDELTGDGTNTYSYNANGTTASEVTPGGTVASTTDAYGSQVSQGTESYNTDALGRTTSVTGSSGTTVATMSYAGSSALISADGSSTYSYDPGGRLTGIGLVGGGTSAGVLAYTDAHTDVVGDFTASGASLSGSRAYDPWGTVLSSSGTLSGRLGYQSAWTDPATSQVDMGSRWYSPSRGGFSNRDTAAVNPAPASGAANPFAYVGDDPMGATDPTGHLPIMMTGGGTTGSVAEQEATHPCDRACESHPPQVVSQAQLRQMQAKDHRLEAQAAARERAARTRAKAAAQARARAHSSCSWTSLSCDIHKAGAAIAKGRHAVAVAVDATVSAVSDAADDTYADVVRPAWELAVRAAQDEVNAIQDAAEYGIHAAGTAVSFAAQAGSRVYRAATAAASAIGREAVNVVKTAYHDAAKAVTATVTFVKHHAAAITSIVAGVVVFAGCEAVTAGIGSIGCAALAGAAANMASYAVTAAQTGHFSVGGLLVAGVTGAVIGAASAGLLDGASGLLSSGIDDAASSLAESAVGDATDETSEAAADTADAGSESSGEDAAARDGEESGPSCGGESFTAGTKVLLADGKKERISALKKGQKVLATDTRTGKNHAESIAAVLVHHDRDLYDLKVRTAGRTAVIDTTSNHLFWDQTSRRWVKAAALKYGTHLRTPSGGTATVVGGHTPRDTTGWMWDLTITPSHDFYIQTADTAILVHNTSCRTFGSLSPSGRMDLPNTEGVYKITMDDGTSYVGKASDIHIRMHQAFQAGAALRSLGYTSGRVAALDWLEMPGEAAGSLFEMEADWIRYEGGIENLANRINSPGNK